MGRQYEEVLASSATVREEIGLGLGWVRLATDQSHQVAATAAKKRRQALRVFQIIDVFHAFTLRPTRNASILFLCNQDWQQGPKVP
jgi:hypothetical protein